MRAEACRSAKQKMRDRILTKSFSKKAQREEHNAAQVKVLIFPHLWCTGKIHL
jgi:hypothetical protein